MNIIECEQGSPEWHAERLGKASASRMSDLTAKTKSGWSASRANYAAELVAERLTGTAAERYTNAAMAWGTDHEGEARQLYELMSDCSVATVGCVIHPTISMSCASPDGLIGNDGLVEIKCPNTATHIETLLGAEIDGKYIKQMQWQMACCGRQWCDFVSFDPRLPGEMQLHVTRVMRDPEMIAVLEKEVTAFLGEVDATVRQLEAKYRQREAAE